ncbi:MAG: hypothetical protein AABX12_04725 [Nanoarchaeota archaeon]
MKHKIDYEIQWWKEWLDANGLKKLKMVEKLPLVQDIGKKTKTPEDMQKRIFAMQLNGYFEDLQSAMYVRIALEEKKPRKRS